MRGAGRRVAQGVATAESAVWEATARSIGGLHPPVHSWELTGNTRSPPRSVAVAAPMVTSSTKGDPCASCGFWEDVHREFERTEVSSVAVFNRHEMPWVLARFSVV